ncbi:MAG: NTP transferase domain-containing protein, partial [Armatimonadota bacterium]|nr:NTP transferase domain-containing protein [Armatimonadota bacterium]
VLAAGKGRRMGLECPKVLAPLLGRPLVCHVLDKLAEVGIERPIIVVGAGARQVRQTLGENYQYAFQEEQLGSGHAVLCAADLARNQSRSILVMCGDSPLFKTSTIRSLMEVHSSQKPAITLVSAILDDPRGYGRVIRDETGEITAIVEEVGATDEQKAIKEINGGCYAFDAEWLWNNLDLISENEAGEKCLTQMVDIAIRQRKRVISVTADSEEVLGVNTPGDLVVAERILAGRI